MYILKINFNFFIYNHMKFLLSYKLFEKTSLINIGVPPIVMKGIQRNYAISDDAKWQSVKLKSNIASALKQKKNTLIISVCKNKIFITFSYNKEYYIETYILTENDDFGNEQWQRQDRIKTDLSDAVKKIERGCTSYKLTSGEWLHEFSNRRKARKEESIFETITNSFKRDFAENFTKIVKRLYGKKANIITDIIVNHLKNVKQNLTDEQIREILYLNVNRAKDIDVLKKKQQQKDPYELYNDIVKSNSLTIFDEYLITFEDEYSDKYKEYLNIPLMIKKWSRDKIMTAFMVYLYTKKLIDL